MKTVDQWLDEYGESHKNKTNKLIHWICIPLIVFSLVGLLWIIPTPAIFESSTYLNWATIVLAAALLFYIRLSIPLFIGFVIISALMVLGNATLFQMLDENWVYHLLVSIGIFVIAWIGQFIGHNIEGKKPSFFKDLQFLLIGPAWLLHFMLKSVGLPYKNS
ncbi:MAG: Mpo1-like protein [Chitinophagales bacterium]